MSTQELIKRSLTNSPSIDTEQLDNTNYVSLSFSSELPYLRTDEYGRYFYEVLDHNNVDTSRFNNMAVLIDHDWTKQVGVAERVWIEDESKGQAVVKISRSEFGNEFYQDIQDGIRTNISVGYSLSESYKKGGKIDGIEVRRYGWAPHEISFVSVPADPGVGVGRSLEQDQEPKKDQEKERVAEITKLGRKFGVSVSVAIANGVTVERFIEQLKSGKLPSSNELSTKGNSTMNSYYFTDATGATRSTDNFPLAGAIAALESIRAGASKPSHTTLSMERTDAHNMIDASNKLAEEVTGLQGRCAVDNAVSLSNMFRSLSRADAVNTTTSAGQIVPTDHRDDLFIEYLRDQSPLLNRVGLNLSGLRGDVSIPKQSTGVNGGWVAEDGSVDTEALTFGGINMTPHTFTAASAMTRRLMQQSSPTIEAVVRSDLLQKNIAELEETILVGDSASTAEQPDGIWNLSGASTVTINKKGEPTYRELAKFVSTAKKSKTLITKNMSDSDVDNHSFVWVVSAEMEEYFTTTLTSANSHKFMMEDDKILNIPVIVSPHVGANDFGLIDPSQIILGTWSAVDIVLDDATKAASGGRIIRSFYDLDIGFRHEKSFVLVKNPTT